MFDEVGRVEFVLLPDGEEENYKYALAGNGIGLGVETTHTDAEEKVHRSRRNALGEKTREVAADGGITEYDYDELGNLIEVDGPLSGDVDVVSITYDSVLGHKESMSDPDKGDWTYRHNALGELICQIDANQQGTKIVRDDLGRKVARNDLTNVNNIGDCSGTIRGTSTWQYGAFNGTEESGQVTHTSAQYYDGDGANHTTTRSYNYDSELGRIESVATVISDGAFSRSYTESTTYDQFGRVFQSFDASGEDRGVRHIYNSYGFLWKMRESRFGIAGQVYWSVVQMDARGNVTEAEMGNGTQVFSTYDPATGVLEHRLDDTGQILAQDLWLDWDAVGNMTHRQDLSGTRDQEERFFYDDRHRLKRVESSTNGGSWTERQLLNYDLAGNITCKSDVSTATCSGSTESNYTYHHVRRHAVVNAGGTTLNYDENGNVVSDSSGRNFDYTTFDKVRRVEVGTDSVEFHYGADRARTLKRELTYGTVESRTHYVGSVEVVLQGSSPGGGEFRRYIGGVAIATWFPDSQISQTRYLHKDHLGSLNAISDENGQVVVWMSFDAWGKRRDADAWHPYSEPPSVVLEAMLAITPRGFTGHEHVDIGNIIHMNGRIYDSHLGRFLQADPFVEDSTTLNRYTYVHNNPLAYSDPSGYFGLFVAKKAAKKLGRAVMRAIGPEASSVLLAVGCGFTGPAYAGCMAAGNYEMTRAFGGSQSDAFRNGAIAGVTAAAFQGTATGIDSLASNGTITATQAGLMQTVGYGIIGGVQSSLQGGRFGHGFLSAGITQAAAPGIGAVPGGLAGQTIAAAIVGGTVSEITGGKFANGAVTAAMSFAAGSLANRQRKSGEIHLGGRSIDAETASEIIDNLKATLDVDATALIEGRSGAVNYDPRDIAEIAQALNHLAHAQGDNFFTSPFSAPERAMLMRVILGKGDQYTAAWFHHESAEAGLLRGSTHLGGNDYVSRQQQAHRQVLQAQGNTSYDLYHPAVVRSYPHHFGPRFPRY